MKYQKTERKLLISISIVVLIIVSLACNVNNIDPEDVRLQAPITTTAKTFEDFLKQLNMIPKGGLMAPWITEPATDIFQAEPIVVVAGWAALDWDSEIVIYEVTPNEDLTVVNAIKNRLDSTVVIENNYLSWRVAVTLPSDRQYLAARIETANNTQSPFSNIIYVSRLGPAALEITSPEKDSIATSNIDLSGTGEPNIGLKLLINGQTTPISTVITANGNWIIEDIPLTIAGFDKNYPTLDTNQNNLTVKAEATGQSAEIVVRRLEPVSLSWPYRRDEGTSTVWDPNLAKVTAFAFNDWHHFTRNSNHPALDISSGKNTKLYAVADGTVVSTGASKDGNYIIVDAGGWGYLYLHILESPSALKEKYHIEIGDKVHKNQAIASEGGSGGFPIHLHIEARIWKPDVNRSSYSAWWSGDPINLNPSDENRQYFGETGKNLYNWWGTSDYCLPSGCWEDVEWDKINLGNLPGIPYEQSCWTKDGDWAAGSFSPYSSRAFYCKLQPQECPCLK